MIDFLFSVFTVLLINGWFEVKVTYTHVHALTDTDTNPKQASTYPYYVPRNAPILFFFF